MKKLALSVVVLMVAGAGATMSAVGCSSSSSSAGAADSGSPDVTSGDDSSVGTDSGPGDDSSSTGDTGTPTNDGGAPEASSCATMACTTDASIPVMVPTGDGGMMDNTACETCLATNCSVEECACLSDTSLDDAGAPVCSVFAGCVYTEFLTNLQNSDAGTAADLKAAEATCVAATTPGACSQTLGGKLIACIAGKCSTQCVGP